ncbi:hypothetical protein DCCM_3857 [Desulfocucumis palustris]|uniref:Uncharacterized protein n=1 Tax=Desulfocucumis palustris TaxID=1898651 RepID=A0A2L2XEG4_9FIRM|nr:hypothetical protein DCCM_3857 [Desulfocucumis palustris]
MQKFDFLWRKCRFFIEKNKKDVEMKNNTQARRILSRARKGVIG